MPRPPVLSNDFSCGCSLTPFEGKSKPTLIDPQRKERFDATRRQSRVALKRRTAMKRTTVLVYLEATLTLMISTGSALPLIADETSGHDARVEVLYHCPLVHDQNWRIKAGPRGPENQLFRAF